MTEEEAKKEIIDMANALQLIPNTSKGKAVLMALKALEQEAVLDKIRAEIRNEQNMDYKCHRKTYDNCLRIIDKYRGDMKGEE